MFDVASMGTINLDYAATFLDELSNTPLPGAPAKDCVDLYAGQCGLPSPEYRHRFLATWITPYDASVSLTWRHIGETTLDGLDASTAASRPEQLSDYMEARNYLDLAVTYDWTENLQVRAGANNLLGRDAPITTNAGTGTGNNNTYPGLFDVSTYFFAGVTVKF